MGKLAELLKNNDIILAIGLVVIVLMMIIPIPAQFLDLLLTLNISLSVLILLVCLYTKEPLEYSSFPTIILIATLFRLGLNVTSTRLILLFGDAGEVIESFGSFVVGGNYVVGCIIFVILVIINFMVITGGAGRVAEVSARFTLDSMPGKQLSIDADLNAGLIDEKEAKARRKKLEREADFYGTMDGASKFVKGDATAGLIITVINIVGGLIIGIMQLKMEPSAAVSTYTILTVGDGLVSQIPALIISTATGLIISRSSGSEKSLSADITTEMFSSPKVMFLVAGLLLVMGTVPGMPTIPFFLVAAALGGYGWYKRNADIEEVKQEEIKKVEEQTTQAVAKKRKKATRESVMELLNIETLEIEIGYRLVSLLDVQRGGDLLERIGQIRRQTAIDFGIVLPSIRVRDNLQLAPNTYQVKLKGVALESGDVYPDRSLAMNSMGGEDNPNIMGIKAIEPAFHLPAIWIEEKDKEYAEMVGYTVVSASAVISTHLTELIRKNAADILTRHDIAQLIENLKKEVSEDYVNDLMKDVATSDVQQVIQNLLREKVSVRDLRTILETISLEIKKNRNPNYLTEQCRLALARNIANQNLSDTGELLAITLSQEVEQVIAQGINPDGESLTLDPDFVKQLMDSLNFEFEKAIQQTGSQPVILCSSPIRMIFRKLIERTYPQIAIMSYNEVTNNIKARSIGTIKVNMSSIM
ncbi:flagellar biosynthesis protein FlhA [bacterium]|nr:flagellar biosynthesis protein FlhA [bacterium]